MNVKRLIPIVVVLLVAVALIVPSTFAGNTNTNTTKNHSHSWGGYHWARTSNPISIKLGDNVTSAWDSYLVAANADWNSSSVLNTSLVAGGTTSRCRPTAGRGEVCNSKYGSNGWLGLAQIWLSGGHISQGTAKMNDTYFAMAAYNTPAERAHVMCQEVGHIFGLGHQDESGASLKTCMDYADDSTYSQHPNAHDYAMLESIYSHLDSTTGSFFAPAGFNAAASNNAADWGTLIEVNGRDKTYLRDYGNGNMVYTFVYGVNPERVK
jgi:hypothetical protein